MKNQLRCHKGFVKAWQELYPHGAVHGALFSEQGRKVHRNP